MRKTYHDGSQELLILNNIDFELNSLEKVAILGASGSGKSTFLHLIAGLEQPDSGNIELANRDINAISDNEKSLLRNKELGFIYQFHHLLADFTALENIAMPLFIRNEPRKQALTQAKLLLEKIGLKNRATHRPDQLSGGERQRVAIARALIGRPKLILADEPTGNLDNHSANQVFNLMLNLGEQYNTSFIVVTHDERLAQKLDKIYNLHNGKLHIY